MSPSGSNPAPLALVTGGTRGIGAAVSRRFLESGFRVHVTARSEDSFQQFRAGLANTELASRLLFSAVDFGDPEPTRAFLAEVADWPALDALVNNAGTNINNPIHQLDDDDLAYLDVVNLQVPIRLMRAAIGPMRRSGGGRVVNIASIWSVVTRSGRIAYTASKFGLVGASKTAAVDLAPDGILVNAVSPGFTMTELTRRTLSPDDEAVLSERVPLGRFAQPGEMAGMVYFLCSAENTYLTGQNIVIDGGYTVV